MQATKRSASSQSCSSWTNILSPAVSWISDDVLNISAILLSSLEPKMYNLTDRL